ncbi:MAG TPA: gamma-glutamylcyclotransferase [Phycisphaerales bacterium]|nr:gamma-glutamylcyclotransferase [Phycisphaerales bacterium]
MNYQLKKLSKWLEQNNFEKEAIAVKNLIPLFVYGTLRKDEKNHYRLEGAEFLGERVLFGYARTIGVGPAIIPNDEDDHVLGELYGVEPEVLEKIDEYEGAEYPWELVRLEDGTEVNAYIYKPKQNKEPV